MDSQVAELENCDNEWAIEKIVSHHGQGSDAIFKAMWKLGDRTWAPYSTARHLGVLKAYLEAMGADRVSDLNKGSGTPLLDPQVFLGSLCVLTLHRKPMKWKMLVPHCSPSPTILNVSPPSHLELFAISFHMPLPHARVDLSKPGLTLMDELGNFHLFLWVQVHEHIRFNCNLQASCVSTTNLILPGGYTLFVILWNADLNCPYQFSVFNPTNRSSTVHGVPIPDSLLNELDPPPTLSKNPSEPQFTPQRICTIERMFWGSAECEACYLKCQDTMQD